MFSKAIMISVMVFLSGCFESVEQFECRFMRIAGKYQTDSLQLKGTSTLITVRADGRAFMFRRDQIIACEAIE